MMKRLALCFALACASIAPAPPSFAQAPVALDQLKRADGAMVVPDRFLRSWDPVTLFFDHDVGPANGGPEDNPERLVTMRPDAPGAWQWLGPRALQFRPADAWKPLAPVEIEAGHVKARLVPLLPTPESTNPSDQSDPVTDLDRIALTFADPVDVAALSRLISIELRRAISRARRVCRSRARTRQARRQADLSRSIEERRSRRARRDPAVEIVGRARPRRSDLRVARP
jgi:hypothetical protein